MEAIVVAAASLELGPFQSKPTTITPGQLEAARALWHGDAEGASVGVWQCGPGMFTARRENDHEICFILSGSGELRSDRGVSLKIAAGDVVVLPMGWSGTWVVTEEIRKCFVMIDAGEVDTSGEVPGI